MKLEQLFELMADKRASDLLLSSGSPVTLKIHGALLTVNQKNVLTGDEIIRMLSEVLSEQQLGRLLTDLDLNVGLLRPGLGSFRLSAFKQRGDFSAVFRYIPPQLPNLTQLNIPPNVGDLIHEPRGLILVCGATGSGKSTSIAAMIESYNESKAGHVLTFEEPIEYYFRPNKSIFNQREIGLDASNFAVALKNGLRQSPDLIFIGEIRDHTVMSAAISYALSGHLVISTLHANNSYHALSRILSMYPAESRAMLLSDLSAALKGVVSQRLIKATTGGRMPAFEVLHNTQLIADLLEQGKLGDIKEAMQNALATGSQTFEQSLMKLVNEGVVALPDALKASDSPTNLMWLMNNQGLTKPAVTTQTSSQKLAAIASFQEFTFN